MPPIPKYGVFVKGKQNTDLPANETSSDSKSLASPSDEVPPIQVPLSKSPKGPISGGILNGKAVNLVKPAYPSAAKAVKAAGAVNVQILIDEEGNVISASAVSGHPLLRAVSEQAARASKFSPTLLSGQAVKVTGVVVYYFVPQ